ncbi:hypothetical protein SAMN06296036_11631 [Pseudobacteriovorax antillogorgiicola]|uniref:Uncharacterized protein n=1 Tax=Pseudobacteriovorax antillogorgiicola TaxID=1513793 RepID=A0A1Y6CEX2_9BACT|nr:hypothetical protein EDD56_116123 [Pseudobacteriovorax antillogorgiicola]SMF52031.1 hypothetical protein SAMN06296036_11631 [Pseudobacteriovorax antillogorgiicola]
MASFFDWVKKEWMVAVNHPLALGKKYSQTKISLRKSLTQTDPSCSRLLLQLFALQNILLIFLHMLLLEDFPLQIV